MRTVAAERFGQVAARVLGERPDPVGAGVVERSAELFEVPLWRSRSTSWQHSRMHESLCRPDRALVRAAPHDTVDRTGWLTYAVLAQGLPNTTASSGSPGDSHLGSPPALDASASKRS